MGAIVGTNVKVEVQATLGSPITVSAVTLASPGVVSATAHGLSDGDIVRFTVAGGMVQLDGQAVRVASSATDSFSLEGIDTTTFSAWTSGTCTKIASFSTLSSAQSVTMPNPQPAKLDTTTLLDVEKQYVYGLPDAPDGSITALFNPGGTAEGLIKAATRTNTAIVCRITFAGGQKTVFNANWSGGSGFDMQQNAVAHATISFTPVREVIHYAS